MGKIIASRIDIEDYYGMAMDTIELGAAIEIDAEEFSVRVNNFTYTGYDGCDDDATIRLQYEHEDSVGDDEEIDLATTQIVEVIMDYSETENMISEDCLYDDIHGALELVM
jgi:hypothetical protein